MSHSANPPGRLNGAIARRTEVAGIFPRLVGAIPLERSNEGAVQRARRATVESIAPIGDDPLVGLPAPAVRSARP